MGDIRRLPVKLDVKTLAKAMLAGEDCEYALHDALLEAGRDELAKHFDGTHNSDIVCEALVMMAKGHFPRPTSMWKCTNVKFIEDHLEEHERMRQQVLAQLNRSSMRMW